MIEISIHQQKECECYKSCLRPASQTVLA